MSHLFKVHYWLSIMFALVSFNCCATDSTSIAQLAMSSNKLVSVEQETVPDDDDSQCLDVSSAKQTNHRGDDPPISSACPREYPLPRSITSTVHGNFSTTDTIITLKCCKPKIKYEPKA